MEKINRLNIGDHLFEKQCSFLGKTVDEISKEPFWKTKYFLTKEQYEEFKKYSILLIKKILHCNKSKAEYTFNYFYAEFGIRIKE